MMRPYSLAAVLVVLIVAGFVASLCLPISQAQEPTKPPPPDTPVPEQPPPPTEKPIVPDTPVPATAVPPIAAPTNPLPPPPTEKPTVPPTPCPEFTEGPRPTVAASATPEPTAPPTPTPVIVTKPTALPTPRPESTEGPTPTVKPTAPPTPTSTPTMSVPTQPMSELIASVSNWWWAILGLAATVSSAVSAVVGVLVRRRGAHWTGQVVLPTLEQTAAIEQQLAEPDGWRSMVQQAIADVFSADAGWLTLGDVSADPPRLGVVRQDGTRYVFTTKRARGAKPLGLLPQVQWEIQAVWRYLVGSRCDKTAQALPRHTMWYVTQRHGRKR